MPRRKINLGIKQLKKDVNRLKKMSETKYHDEPLNLGQIHYNVAHTSTLCDPDKGTDEDNRLASEINPYRVMIEGHMTFGSTEEVVRVTLLQSKQGFIPSTIATSGSTQLYELAANSESVHSQYDFDNRKHFTILYDKKFKMDAFHKIQMFNINKKVSRKIRFEAGSNTASQGQLYLCVNSNVATSGPIVKARSRVLFKD